MAKGQRLESAAGAASSEATAATETAKAAETARAASKAAETATTSTTEAAAIVGPVAAIVGRREVATSVVGSAAAFARFVQYHANEHYDADDDQKSNKRLQTIVVSIVANLFDFARRQRQNVRQRRVNGRVLVTFAHRGDHLLLDDTFGYGIGNRPLQIVTHGNIDFTGGLIARLQQYHHTVALVVGGTHAPTFAKLVGELCSGIVT